jgi:hypothetical protein
MPPTLHMFFTWLNYLTVPGVMKMFQLKPECTLGTFGGGVWFNI